MGILFTVYIILLIAWFVGISVGAYHVFKYRLPGDATEKVFWIFLAIAAAVFLISVFWVAGTSWGSS